MGIEELSGIKPIGEAFATIFTERVDGQKDPLCRVTDGIAPKAETDSHFIVALLGDEMSHCRVGTLELVQSTDERAHLVGFKAEASLIEDPLMLGYVVQLSMEHVGVEAATLREIDTNIPPSTLRMAGAVAIKSGSYQFALAA